MEKKNWSIPEIWSLGVESTKGDMLGNSRPDGCFFTTSWTITDKEGKVKSSGILDTVEMTYVS